ncbi:tRNA lysidine(34) synthetase TilS [Geotalea uraniireducens]|uniref:tRNA(Ile)-lysidine synthase n=1 Tax=Geotalea uraniireducens (strain Rf4) TaxID=351605 RepID=A5G541_GEOUR|nr:tRNA lysidine(34) synthetase TilS [Geotalea uraniireducens]ABQ26909.1 tRNA(Ile)-lysidine synthetase [Geotalea uraniireducens Rf4]
MLKKVAGFIEEHDLFSPGDTVVVAVSGGADSVALLDVLAGFSSLRLRLIVVHLNHCLRGAESDADEAFVRELAGKYGVTFVTQAVDVQDLSKREKLSLEEAGRAARYRFFSEIAASCKARAVVLAHHADDQAETVLMRLLRGAGGSGLCAMAAKSAGMYVRPLLSVTRFEIEAYLRERGLVFRTDSSNADVNFLRNRVRHELIPFLKSYNPAITDRLVTTAAALSEDEEILDKVTTEAFNRFGTVEAGRVKFVVAGIATELRGLRLRLYRRAVLQVKGDLTQISARHLNDIDSLLLSASPNSRLVLPEGFTVKRCYGELTFQKHGDASSVPYEFFIEGPGSYPIPGGGLLTVEVAAVPESWDGVPATVAYFDGDGAPFPWLVRTFIDGDVFSPLGMARSKKVKKLFIDKKIPLPFRRRIPLLFSGETLFWVGGVMPATAGRVTASTKLVLRAEILDFTP